MSLKAAQKIVEESVITSNEALASRQVRRPTVCRNQDLLSAPWSLRRSVKPVLSLP